MSRKAWYIAWKDTVTRFRDRNGILLMLVAPLVLAAVIGAAFGGLGDDPENVPLTDIPLAIVNQDQGPIGQTVEQILHSDDLQTLLEPQAMDDLEMAKELAGRGEIRAVVHIPAGSSEAIQRVAEGEVGDFAFPGREKLEGAHVFIYTDPGARISPIVVQSLVAQIANDLNAAALGQRMIQEQLQAQPPETIARVLPQLLATIAEAAEGQASNDDSGRIQVVSTIVGNPESQNTNPLAYFAPSMAILFLMFTLFDAASSILEEEREGTLARMMVTPTAFSSILLGKIAGVFATGLLQLAVLILASQLLFGLSWGSSPLGLALMVVAVVAAASSLGALIVAFSRDERQAGIVGSAVALVFAILGGNFVAGQEYPDFLQPLSKLTLNRWALDGLTDLSLRGLGLQDVLLEAGVLLAAAVLFFTLAVWRLPKRFVK